MGDFLLLTLSMVDEGSRLSYPPFKHEVYDLYNQSEDIWGDGISLFKATLTLKKSMNITIDAHRVRSSGNTCHNPVNHTKRKAKPIRVLWRKF